MEIIGRIKKIEPTKEYGANGFKKRELVIVTEDQYPQHILIEFVQDKCALLDTMQEGQNVKVAFDVRGREWVNPQGEAKYFNSLNGWKVELLQANTPPPMAPPVAFEEAASPFEDSNEPDDLPF
jgi:hypothetical protein